MSQVLLNWELAALVVVGPEADLFRDLLLSWLRGRPGLAPAGEALSCCAARKYPKKRAPLAVSPQRCCGATCDARVRGALQNSLCCCAAPLRQLQRVRARSVDILRCPRAPRPLRFSARPQGLENHSDHRCARPPPRERFAPRGQGRATRWPVWLFRFPSGCAWGGVLAGWRVQRSMHALRELTGRSCLSVALKERKASSCGPPRQRPDTGCPAAKRRGRSQWGRLLLPSFLGETRKEGAPPGANPGLPPPSSNSIKPAHSESDYKFHSCPRKQY